MTRKQRKAMKAIQALGEKEQLTTIQALGIEGVNFDSAMSSLLDGKPISGVDGISNVYSGYSAQVSETYKKYHGDSEYGCAQVRSVVDTRSSFIAGEGMSISYGEEVTDNHRELFKMIIEKNKLEAGRLMSISKQLEMSGYTILTIIKGTDENEYVPFIGIKGAEKGKALYSPIYYPNNPLKVKAFRVKSKGKEDRVVSLNDFVFIRTGGDGLSDDMTTKVGIVLTDCENYDRALKGLRRINYVGARITPDFKTNSSSETAALVKFLNENSWKIGDARVGTAEFNYKTPNTGAVDNIQKELASTVKTISGATGVLVHWLGWVDMMSNRATAEEMYAVVNNATIMERNALADGLKELLIKAQQKYIDAGGTLIKEATTDFELRLPLIDFGHFKEMVEAYSQLYADDVVSMATYRNIVPGIDPEFEREQIEKEREEEPEVNMSDVNFGVPPGVDENEDEPEEDDDGPYDS